MWSYNAPRYGRARAPDYVPDVRDSPAAWILAVISQSFTRRPVHTVSQKTATFHVLNMSVKSSQF